MIRTIKIHYFNFWLNKQKLNKQEKCMNSNSRRIESSPIKFSIVIPYLHKKEEIEKKREKIVVYSAFQHFLKPDRINKPIPIKNDNMWSHIGELETPIEYLIQNRYPVSEICFVGSDLIAVRSTNGLCAIYKSWTNDFVCYFNGAKGEIIRSIYYNARNGDLLKIVSTEETEYSGIMCMAIKYDDLMKGNIDKCTQIFTDIPLKYPAFFEFDTPNAQAVVYSDAFHCYRFFSLDDYSLLYEIPNKDVSDIKCTPNVLMAIKFQSPITMSLIFHDIVTGTRKGHFIVELTPNSDVEFIERSGPYIIFKQFSMPITIMDLLEKTKTILYGTENTKSSQIAFLYKAFMFLVYRKGYFDVYSFKGDKIYSLRAKNGRKLDVKPIQVSQDQDLIIGMSSNSDKQMIHMFSLTDGNEIFSSEINKRLTNGFSIKTLAIGENPNCIVCGDEVGTTYFWL